MTIHLLLNSIIYYLLNIVAMSVMFRESNVPTVIPLGKTIYCPQTTRQLRTWRYAILKGRLCKRNWLTSGVGQWRKFGFSFGGLKLTIFRQEDRHNKLSLGSGRQLANLKNKLLLRNIADLKGYWNSKLIQYMVALKKQEIKRPKNVRYFS